MRKDETAKSVQRAHATGERCGRDTACKLQTNSVRTLTQPRPQLHSGAARAERLSGAFNRGPVPVPVVGHRRGGRGAGRGTLALNPLSRSPLVSRLAHAALSAAASATRAARISAKVAPAMSNESHILYLRCSTEWPLSKGKGPLYPCYSLDSTPISRARRRLRYDGVSVILRDQLGTLLSKSALTVFVISLHLPSTSTMRMSGVGGLFFTASTTLWIFSPCFSDCGRKIRQDATRASVMDNRACIRCAWQLTSKGTGPSPGLRSEQATQGHRISLVANTFVNGVSGISELAAFTFVLVGTLGM